MKTLRKIFKGCHYCLDFLFPKLYFSTSLYQKYSIKFDESAIYDIGDDQSDVNKLFGFGYGLHHIDSDRFGWRYNLENKQVEIVEYCYECGNRLSTKHIAWLALNETAYMSIQVNVDKSNKSRTVKYFYDFNKHNITVEKTYKMKHKWFLFYRLGLYFGGNIAAPHDIFVNME